MEVQGGKWSAEVRRGVFMRACREDWVVYDRENDTLWGVHSN